MRQGLLALIRYRPFLNTDPPKIVDLWRRTPKVEGLVDSIDIDVLEKCIFSKQYFDRHGLIVAESGDGKIMGFVHAGFPPDDQLSELNYSVGIVSQIRIAAEVPESAIEDADGAIGLPTASEMSQRLLELACEYCKSKGATEIHVGSYFPHPPFYLGLYGGSRLPGVLDHDQRVLDCLTRFGFQQHDKIVILHRKLCELKTIMGRQQMAVRRNYVINASDDPLEQSWWESCTLGRFDRERFSVIDKRSKAVCGQVSYWDMGGMAEKIGGRPRGLYGLQTNPELRRTGLATYLVGESLKFLAKQGISLVESQARESDAASLALFAKLGFEAVGSGSLLVFRF